MFDIFKCFLKRISFEIFPLSSGFVFFVALIEFTRECWSEIAAAILFEQNVEWVKKGRGMPENNCCIQNCTWNLNRFGKVLLTSVIIHSAHKTTEEILP